jgi:hypothetical protein
MALITTIIFIVGCAGKYNAVEEETRIKVPVTAAGIQIMQMADYTELFATSRFLNKSVINAPVAGYIEDVFFNPGDNVRKGDEVFRLKTREAEVLRNDSLNQLYFPGLIHVKASIDGMVIAVNHPRGDYVMEGESLGAISVPSSLVFILDVPFETTRYIKINSDCKIILPDDDSIPAIILSQLPSMNEGPQTQQFIVRPKLQRKLPENLIAKIRVVIAEKADAMVLPQTCILTDEVMQHYWVMKLINDTTAVKVMVKTGLVERDMVEITEPEFTTTDLFLSSGNYGLGDTVTVEVKGTFHAP